MKIKQSFVTKELIDIFILIGEEVTFNQVDLSSDERYVGWEWRMYY